MCLPGFTVPVVDDVANLPVDGSLLLAIYKPQYGIAPNNSTNASFSGGYQRNGAVQILLVFQGTINNGGALGCQFWKNSSAGAGTPTNVHLPQGWMPVPFFLEPINPSYSGYFASEGYY